METSETADTAVSVMIDFENMPSVKALSHIIGLAVDRDGRFDRIVRSDRFYATFVFQPNNQAGAVDFWERALMFRDYMEDGVEV